jgi:hypothetical protein
VGVPARHAGAPYATGETIFANDIETDVANLYAQLGNIEDVNVAAAADIAASKLADLTIPGAKFVADTITQGKIAANSISDYDLTADSTVTVATSAWTDRSTTTYTTSADGAGPVVLLAVSQWSYSSGLGSINDGRLRFDRDGTTIGIEMKATVSRLLQLTTQVINLHVDTGLSANTAYDYTLQYKMSAAAAPILTIDKTIFLVLELRR